MRGCSSGMWSIRAGSVKYLFFIILIYLNEHKKFYSRIQQLLKFILIYNLNLNLSFFYFYLRARSLWSMLGVDFYFPCNLFYFRSSTILFESPSTTEFNNFFSLFCTKSSRRLCLIMVSSPTSAKIEYAALWDLGAWRAPTVIAMSNIFKNSKWIKKWIFLWIII